MQNSRSGNLSILLLTAVLFTGCGGDGSVTQNTNETVPTTANSNTAKTNVEELGMHVAIPYETDEAVWRQDQDNKKITAVLRLSSQDADKLTKKAESVKPPEPAVVSAEAWFPAELIAQSEMSGDNTVKGTSYAANEFYLPPYTDGKIMRAENTDYFILELVSK